MYYEFKFQLCITCFYAPIQTASLMIYVIPTNDETNIL